jgi:murein DD-endopeptidase MepM/ murein hydrolase activator NlpD
VAPGSEVKGFWLGKPLLFFQIAAGEFVSLLGVDLNLTPGDHELEIQVLPPGNPLMRRHDNLHVVSKDYGVERLQLPENMVTLDAATLKRVRREQARFSALWNKQSPDRHWTKPFTLPVPGKRLSPFGLRRIINDEPKSPHCGLDLRAALGDPVEAANSGRVALVGDFFFSGNAVVIDHGLGMYTMYFHLSQLKVSQGDRVEQGSIIGLAGATGRASGPHLHWGARLGGARIDPLELLRVTSE